MITFLHSVLKWDLKKAFVVGTICDILLLYILLEG